MILRINQFKDKFGMWRDLWDEWKWVSGALLLLTELEDMEKEVAMAECERKGQLWKGVWCHLARPTHQELWNLPQIVPCRPHPWAD
jgi:hypothetical protein